MIASKALLSCGLWVGVATSCYGLALAGSFSSSVLAKSLVIAQQPSEVKVPSFYVKITLTEKARQRLAQAKETIVVSPSISGQPKPGLKIGDDVGGVPLTTGTVELPGAGQAMFNQLSFPAGKLNQITDQDYLVNVNAFSGRKSSPDNILSCDFFDSKISKLQPGITLKCGLIGEYKSQFVESSTPSNANSTSPHAVPALW